MTYNELVHNILKENEIILKSINSSDIDLLVNELSKPNIKVMGYSAGRMGFGLKAFLMRLNHLGIPAYWFGDNYIPPMSDNDIFICCSNSGSTKSVSNILDIFKSNANGKTIGFIGNINSYIGKNVDIPIVFMTCNGGINSNDDKSKFNSIQPMTSLTEQTMFLLFDIIAMKLIEKLNININDTKKFHSNIE